MKQIAHANNVQIFIARKDSIVLEYVLEMLMNMNAFHVHDPRIVSQESTYLDHVRALKILFVDLAQCKSVLHSLCPMVNVVGILMALDVTRVVHVRPALILLHLVWTAKTRNVSSVHRGNFDRS